VTGGPAPSRRDEAALPDGLRRIVRSFFGATRRDDVSRPSRLLANLSFYATGYSAASASA
jgi:hypothetical protein